jgi:hypothetical protein
VTETREFVSDSDLAVDTVTGWKGKPTTKPTSFMMTAKFLSVLVLKVENQRQLAPIRFRIDF